MEKLEDQLMSASGKLQRGMRWPVKVRKGPITSFDTMGGKQTLAAICADDRYADGVDGSCITRRRNAP
jgi:hypothetical protein